jgi:hypothetical protein
MTAKKKLFIAIATELILLFVGNTEVFTSQ